MPFKLPAVLQRPTFRRLWFATAVSTFGDWMGFVALNLYVFQMTGSATALAGALVVNSLPNLLVGPFAGAIVDRYSRRKVMVIANLVAAVAFLLLPFAQNIWQIYLFGVLARLATTFLQPAQRALIPDLVGTDHVLEANSALSGVTNITMIVGPAVAGLLSGAIGPNAALWTDALSFVVAAVLVAAIAGELPRLRHSEKAQSMWAEAVDGFRYGVQHPMLRLLLVIGFFSAIAGAVLITIEVVYVADFLGGGEAGYGLLLSVAGVGALTASLIATPIGNKWGQFAVYVFSVLLTGLFYFPYANVHLLWFVIFWAGVHTVPWVLVLIFTETLVQRWSPPEMRGRIFSLLQMQRSAGQILAAITMAPLVDLWGPVVVMNLAGVVYTLVGIYAVCTLPRVRRAEMALATGIPLPSTE